MHTSTAVEASPVKPRRWYHQLYFWVLGAIILGILLGWLAPSVGTAMEPIGTTFVSAMRMLIGPIVFLTIVAGIASVADLKKVGLTGLKALAYFQVGTTVALVMGLVAINIFRLGDGVNAVPDQIKTTDAANKLIGAGESQQWWEFLTHIVPTSVVGPFLDGNILQIIFFAVLFGVALNATGKYGAPVLDGIQRASTRAPHGNLPSERRCAARHPWHAGLGGWCFSRVADPADVIAWDNDNDGFVVCLGSSR